MHQKPYLHHGSRGRNPSCPIRACLLSTGTALALALVAAFSSGRVTAQGTALPGQTPGTPQGPIEGSVGAAEMAKAKAKAEEPPTPAERVIDEAIVKITKLQSVAADLLEDVKLLNQQVSIKGRYLKAANSRVYLRLTVSGLTDTGGTTLQVCDGETLWDYQQVLDSQIYRKLSVKPILERLNSPELEPKFRDQIMTQIGFAGPESLLVGLRRVIRFDVKEEGELEGRKVWIFRGSWRTRQGLVGPDTRPVASAGLLPPYIPSDATLYLGQADGWPYKLLLVGRQPSILQDTRRRGPDGRPIGSLSSIERPIPTRIELTYSNVKLNPSIRVEEFAFQAPPTATVDDSTDLIVRGLDQAIAMQVEKKKVDAAKKEGSLLPQSIEVPSNP